ncbi:ABC transporter substrate-binding protein [Paenibacillus sp. GSMTC-2017]|uniref:ABC transporter substrate-binding protein n=1 Tax=Paenibacillus sp. GSMTC-2017 TaxID=2794350 RepID=UPI0018D632B0|nr:extracellular solute-binding protein [Paenibacillus sp. GSMTC-2017]
MSILITACDQTAITPKGEDKLSEQKKVELSKNKVEIEFWSHYTGWDDIIAEFEKKYPNVNVNTRTFSFDSYVETYEMAIANGSAPDVMIADSKDFGRFAAISGLENLLAHGAEKYRKDFSSSLWDINLSFDKKSLVGFPSGSSPYITYYRADLMEQYGFPSDPEELGKYMEDPENWLKIARALKKDDRYIANWLMDIVQIYDTTAPVFNENMKFARRNESFIDALELASTIYNEGLTSSTDTWTAAGGEALKNGKIAMLYMGTWGANELQSWAPNTTGKWRQTRLPFNLNGWVNSSSFMIPTSSEEKKWAFAFIEYCVTEYSMKGKGNSVPSYLPARESEQRVASGVKFFGGQDLFAMSETLAEQMKETRLTPIDEEAKAIWTRVINEGVERNKSADLILVEAEKQIYSTLGKEIEILSEYLYENKTK